MKFLKLKYILVVLAILSLVILLWKFSSLLSFSDSSVSFEGKSQPEKIYPDAPLVQKIVATQNNFNQINLSLSKFSPKFGDKIILEVLDESCQNVLAKTKLNIFSWKSPGYEKMNFKSIPDSEGKTYCLKITYDPRKEAQKKKASVPAYVSPGNSYSNSGNKEITVEQKDRSLDLKPAYGNSSVWQNFSELIDRMSQYKADFLKNNYLLFIFMASIVLIFLIIIIVAII